MDTTNDTVSTTNEENTPEETPEQTEENFSFRKIFKVVKFLWKSKIGFLCLNLVIVIILSVLTFIAMMYITRKCAASDEGWYLFEKYCYYLGKEKKTWSDAESDCKKRSGHLVKVEDDKENWFVTSVVWTVLKGGAWIGANDLDNEGQMKWVSDDSRVEAGFNGLTSVPQNDDKDCIYIDTSYKWTDGKCGDTLEYICKK